MSRFTPTNGAAGAAGAAGADGAGFFPTGLVAPAGNYITSNQREIDSFTVKGAYYLPVYVPGTINIDRLSVSATYVDLEVSTPIVRLGVYRNNNSTGKPGTLVIDAGSVSVGPAAGIYSADIASTQLTTGWYWFCAAESTSSDSYWTGIVASKGQSTNVPAQFIGSTMAYRSLIPTSSATSNTGYSYNGMGGTYAGGALPSTALSPSVTASNITKVFARVGA